MRNGPYPISVQVVNDQGEIVEEFVVKRSIRIPRHGRGEYFIRLGYENHQVTARNPGHDIFLPENPDYFVQIRRNTPLVSFQRRRVTPALPSVTEQKRT